MLRFDFTLYREKCLLSRFVRCCYDAILTRITSQPSLIADGLFKAVPDTELSLPVLYGYLRFRTTCLPLPPSRHIKMRRHDSNRRHYRPGAGCKHVVMYSYWPTALYGPQSEGSSPAVIFEF